MKRRDFLKTSASGLAVASCSIVAKQKLAHAAEPELVDLEGPAAKALGYAHSAEAVDVKAWPKRAGEAGSKQLCSNCNFRVGEAKEVAAQEGKWVGCQLFPGKVVAEKGWCNSWIEKA